MMYSEVFERARVEHPRYIVLVYSFSECIGLLDKMTEHCHYACIPFLIG